jgi:adenylylsulfate kinase
MLILMAGLPGSGKTTLCQALSPLLSGSILNKDDIRAALFSSAQIEYSTKQDDFCQKVMLEAAGYIVNMRPDQYVFLDGRPFSRKYQIEQAIGAAEALKQPWRILKCVCSDETARERLAAQAGEHPAANRDYALYLRVKAGFEEIIRPKTVINTDHPLEVCVQQARDALR